MTRKEFAAVLAYIAEGCGKSLTTAAAEVYFGLLKDLPLQALQVAAGRVLLEHRYATFPPVGLIREFAVETMRGQVKPMTGAEAWGIAIRAMNKCDVDVEGSVDRAFANVPAIVREAVSGFGFKALYSLPNGSVETARAQFTKLFDGLVERERKQSLLPSVMASEIKQIADNAETKKRIKSVAGQIGVEKPKK